VVKHCSFVDFEKRLNVVRAEVVEKVVEFFIARHFVQDLQNGS